MIHSDLTNVNKYMSKLKAVLKDKKQNLLRFLKFK